MQYIKRMIVMLLVLLLLAAPCFGAEMVMPGGEAIGLKLMLSNLCITQVEEEQPAAQAGLRAGDCIISVNAKQLSNGQELATIITAGKALIVEIERDGKAMTFTVYPQRTQTGWQIGAEVMDCINGIGTISYIDPTNGCFGALGHGVNLPGTSEMLPVSCGTAYKAEVVRVEKSVSGAPGELKGECAEQPIGTIEKNTDNGVFGRIDRLEGQTKLVPVASFSQVHPGDAVIRCCVNGTEVREYSVQILEVYPYAESGRDLLLQITDEQLLAQTGGIVRGMSGSPIIQDGRIVGAVTHVIVDNPTKGYGIFIENMRNAAEAAA